MLHYHRTLYQHTVVPAFCRIYSEYKRYCVRSARRNTACNIFAQLIAPPAALINHGASTRETLPMDCRPMLDGLIHVIVEVRRLRQNDIPSICRVRGLQMLEDNRFSCTISRELTLIRSSGSKKEKTRLLDRVEVNGNSEAISRDSFVATTDFNPPVPYAASGVSENVLHELIFAHEKRSGGHDFNLTFSNNRAMPAERDGNRRFGTLQVQTKRVSPRVSPRRSQENKYLRFSCQSCHT